MEVPHSHGYSENCRGLGVADMAYSIINRREHRVNGELAYHVLDIMEGFHDASSSSTYYKVQSGCERPSPLPLGRFEKEILG